MDALAAALPIALLLVAAQVAQALVATAGQVLAAIVAQVHLMEDHVAILVAAIAAEAILVEEVAVEAVAVAILAVEAAVDVVTNQSTFKCKTHQLQSFCNW